MIISRINQRRNRPRSRNSVMVAFSSKWTFHECHLNMGQSPTPLPLAIAYSIRLVNFSWRNRKQLLLLPLDMLQVLEFRMVTHAARERVSLTTFTFTTPLFWYSFHFAPFELNRSLYDVTLWSLDGLPCVAILFTTLSFPRSICKYCPIAFRRLDQEPVLPLRLILLRRACHGSCSNPQDEEAVTAPFGILLFSIPRGWMRHSVAERQIPSYLHSLVG